MPAAARADLEALLRARHLDRTLTTAQSWEQSDDLQLAPSGVARLDERLGGGWPRGELSEIVGPRSSGRTSVLLTSMAAATSRGEAVACIDTCDVLDVASAAASGVDLGRTLWVRQSTVDSRQSSVDSLGSGMCGSRGRSARSIMAADLDRAIKAFNIVLQAGGFGLVALDLSDMPPEALRALPYTTWMRLQRVLLGTSTASLVLAGEPVARSARGVTLDLGCSSHGRRSEVAGCWRNGLFEGLDVTARVLQGRHVRWGSDEPVRMRLEAGSLQ